MRENRPCGVEFLRFSETGNERNAVLQMRTVKNANNFLRLTVDGEAIKCRVLNGEISLWYYDDAGNVWADITGSPIEAKVRTIWERKVTEGLKIKFNRQGRWYALRDSYHIYDTSVTFQDHDIEIIVGNNAPEIVTTVSAVEFNVTQRPVATLNSITVLPRGTIIDLQHSGHEPTMNMSVHSDDRPFSGSGPFNSVVIMFSPAGYVDQLYVDGVVLEDASTNEEILPFNGVSYFLVGEWDKITQGDDNKNNLQTESNFWVTVKDRDGTVRISPNAPENGGGKESARRFAYDDLNNSIGGY
jgi:hypothetical protein